LDAFLFFDVVEGDIFGNGEDKGLEVVQGAVFGDGLIDFYKGVLGEALGFVVVEDHFMDKVDDLFFVAVDEYFVVPGVSFPDGAYDIVIGIFKLFFGHGTIITNQGGKSCEKIICRGRTRTSTD
jgi:hypothetical protein